MIILIKISTELLRRERKLTAEKPDLIKAFGEQLKRSNEAQTPGNGKEKKEMVETRNPSVGKPNPAPDIQIPGRKMLKHARLP